MGVINRCSPGITISSDRPTQLSLLFYSKEGREGGREGGMGGQGGRGSSTTFRALLRLSPTRALLSGCPTSKVKPAAPPHGPKLAFAVCTGRVHHSMVELSRARTVYEHHTKGSNNKPGNRV